MYGFTQSTALFRVGGEAVCAKVIAEKNERMRDAEIRREEAQ
jgi:hypothetical protein